MSTDYECKIGSKDAGGEESGGSELSSNEIMQTPSSLKTIIIDIAPPGISPEELDHRMNELESLVSTYGGVTIIKRVQKKLTPDYKTFI